MTHFTDTAEYRELERRHTVLSNNWQAAYDSRRRMGRPMRGAGAEDFEYLGTLVDAATRDLANYGRRA